MGGKYQMQAITIIAIEGGEWGSAFNLFTIIYDESSYPPNM
jgi:hypothetical protein